MSEPKPQNAQTETTEARHVGAMTTGPAARGARTAGGPRTVRTTLEIRRKLAVVNATCPRCGVTNARHNYITRTQTKPTFVRVKCSSCGETWKVMVK